MANSKIDKEGREVLDPVPMALPLNFKHPPSLNDLVRSMVRNVMSDAARDAGHESFEEADDFDIEDEQLDPQSPWEMNFDQESAVINGKADPRHNGSGGNVEEQETPLENDEKKPLTDRRKTAAPAEKAKAKSVKHSGALDAEEEEGAQ